MRCWRRFKQRILCQATTWQNRSAMSCCLALHTPHVRRTKPATLARHNVLSASTRLVLPSVLSVTPGDCFAFAEMLPGREEVRVDGVSIGIYQLTFVTCRHLVPQAPHVRRTFAALRVPHCQASTCPDLRDLATHSHNGLPRFRTHSSSYLDRIAQAGGNHGLDRLGF